MRHYPEGQTIHLICTFADTDGAVDPDHLRVELALDDVGTVYEYPDAIERVGAGSYALDVLPTGPGALTYRWIGDGVATPDVQFRVVPSRFGGGG